MPKIVFLIRALFIFGPPFYFGYVGGGVFAPIGWSAGITMLAAGTGWRARGRGILASASIGMCFAAVANVPIYFFGHWLADSGSRSIEFTLITFLLGPVIFGLLTLVHWMRPQRLTNDKDPSSDRTHESRRNAAAFEKILALLNNEKAQLERLPEPVRSEVRRGADCDEITGALGEFGRDPRNPIPVNGPLGEMIYLSNLRTNTSQQIMFHRLGAVSSVNIYEAVSVDGAKWDILFLHAYHPRKSQHAPFGYRIASSAERQPFLLGTNQYVTAFPGQLSEAIDSTSEELLGIPMRPPQLREGIKRTIFARPHDHVARLNIILAILKRETPSLPHAELRSLA